MPNLLRALALGLAAICVPATAFANDPLPRFEDPLCPGVAGLRADAAAEVVGRIRDNAQRIGLTLAADGDCHPNLIVAFLDDGQAFLRSLHQNKPLLFADMNLNDTRALLADPGPARALLSTMVRTRDGMPVPRRDNMEHIPQTGMWNAHSRIYTPTRRDIISALIVFDSGAIEGLSLTQMADYATMRGLAPPGSTRAMGDGSILSIFDSESAPAEMTAGDRVLLATLYGGIPNLPATARMAGLERAVRSAGE